MAIRALVTGGAGLIGSHLADLLLEQGYEVTVLDSLDRDTHRNGAPNWISPHIRLVQGDVREPAAVRAALEGVEVVFHQAAYGGFSPYLRKTVETNVMGTVTLLDELRGRGQELAAFVVASSQAVYGEGTYRCPEHGIIYPDHRPLAQLERGDWEMRCPDCGLVAEAAPTQESKPPVATLGYSASKYFQERIVLGYGRDTATHSVALRYSLTYGPRQSLFNPYTGITSIFSTLILNGIPPVIYEDGRQTRDFIYVEDVARANLFVAGAPEAGGQVFNVGTGKATTVEQYARMLVGGYGRDVELHLPGQFRPADCRHLVADTTRLARLGFQASTLVEQGIERYVSWIAEQGDVREYFSEVHAQLIGAGIVREIQP